MRIARRCFPGSAQVGTHSWCVPEGFVAEDGGGGQPVLSGKGLHD